MSMGPIHLARAEVLLEQRLLSEALACFDHAEQRGADPDRCAAGRWMIFALRGDFNAAWRESDAIYDRGLPDANRFWQGEDLDGKRIILRCLHGLGDAVQFLRYAPLLRAHCAQLIVECSPRAIDLVRCLSGVDEAICWGDNAPAVQPAWDVQIEVMELPYIFRSTLEDLPLADTYICLSENELSQATFVLGSASLPRVGIVWSSGEWNPTRNVPFQLLAPILSRRDCEFWNLQGGPARTCWEALSSSPHRRDTVLLADAGVVPLAAVIAHLNLVITVDTLAAHLAGALGIPCWLLLQYAADWRWMVHRDRSPWYPSLRLLRQATPGDWSGLVASVNRYLDCWVPKQLPRRVAA